jgi:hypothetical protein
MQGNLIQRLLLEMFAAQMFAQMLKTQIFVMTAEHLTTQLTM